MKTINRRGVRWILAGSAIVLGDIGLSAQTGTVPALDLAATQNTPSAQVVAPVKTTGGGTIRGTVKAGNVPLPGVAITATNTLTGKKYATTTDVDGNYAMTIPNTGRYVVRAELAAFSSATNEVRLTADAANQASVFTLQLASRAAQAQGGQQRAGVAAQAQRGVQALNITGDADLADASTGGGATGAALPSLGGLGGEEGAAAATDSVAVSGTLGTTNALGSLNEDQIRQRVEDAMAQARQNGGATGDQMNAVVSMLGGIMAGGPGGPGGGGPGGGGRGGRGGGGGGGGGAFRNMNPAQPHGSIFYQGGNSALNSAPWQPSLVAEHQSLGVSESLRRKPRGHALHSRPYQAGYAPVRVHQPYRPEEPECLLSRTGAGAHPGRARG